MSDWDEADYRRQADDDRNALYASLWARFQPDHLRTPDDTSQAATGALRAASDGNGADPTTTEGRR